MPATKANPGSYGTLNIFSFSGFVLTDQSPPLELITLNRGGLSVSFYPPVRIAAPNWRPIPQADQSNFEKIFGTPLPPSLSFKSATFPNLDDSGKPTLLTSWGDDPVDDWLPRDTFPVMVVGTDHSGKGEQIAEQLLSSLLDWLRVLTKQWWIGKPTEHLAGNLHLTLMLDGPMSASEFPAMRSKGTTANADARRVSADLWKLALNKVAKNQSPDGSDLLLLDAFYAFFSGEHRTAIILATSTFELLRDQVIERHGRSKSSLKASDTDILRHVSTGFEELFGRNLKREDEKLFEFLRSCWVARNNVAHGKPMIWLENGKKNSQVSADRFAEKVEAVCDWLKSV